MKKIIACLLLVVFFSCEDHSKPYSIGIDQTWYSIELNGQQSLLNGFMADLLLEISKEKKREINLVKVSWDNILEKLNKRKYQAVFSAMEPYNFNRARYDFSNDILQTGYVLVTAKDAKYESLDDMDNKHVVYLRGEDSLVILQKYDEIFDETYDSIPKVFSDITKLKIEGALASIIPAYKYVLDLYYNELKIVMPPINDQAIRLVTLKDENNDLLNLFNSALKKLEKSGKLKELKIKWQLPN